MRAVRHCLLVGIVCCHTLLLRGTRTTSRARLAVCHHTVTPTTLVRPRRAGGRRPRGSGRGFPSRGRPGWVRLWRAGLAAAAVRVRPRPRAGPVGPGLAASASAPAAARVFWGHNTRYPQGGGGGGRLPAWRRRGDTRARLPPSAPVHAMPTACWPRRPRPMRRRPAARRRATPRPRPRLLASRRCTWWCWATWMRVRLRLAAKERGRGSCGGEGLWPPRHWGACAGGRRELGQGLGGRRAVSGPHRARQPRPRGPQASRRSWAACCTSWAWSAARRCTSSSATPPRRARCSSRARVAWPPSPLSTAAQPSAPSGPSPPRVAPGQGSFAWAWVLDERPTERERGVTVDVAMSRFATPRCGGRGRREEGMLSSKRRTRWRPGRGRREEDQEWTSL
jgi:hypothetical protein